MCATLEANGRGMSVEKTASRVEGAVGLEADGEDFQWEHGGGGRLCHMRRPPDLGVVAVTGDGEGEVCCKIPDTHAVEIVHRELAMGPRVPSTRGAESLFLFGAKSIICTELPPQLPARSLIARRPYRPFVLREHPTGPEPSQLRVFAPSNAKSPSTYVVPVCHVPSDGGYHNHVHDCDLHGPRGPSEVMMAFPLHGCLGEER